MSTQNMINLRVCSTDESKSKSVHFNKSKSKRMNANACYMNKSESKRVHKMDIRVNTKKYNIQRMKNLWLQIIPILK